MAKIKVVFLHDVPDTTPGADNPKYFRGQTVEMEPEEALPYAINQLISVSSLVDPYAPHEIAKLIPPNYRVVDTVTIAPATVAAKVGAADVKITTTVKFKDGGADLVLADLGAFSTSDIGKFSVVKDGADIKIHAIGEGAGTVSVTYNGVTATAAVTVAAAD